MSFPHLPFLWICLPSRRVIRHDAMRGIVVTPSDSEYGRILEDWLMCGILGFVGTQWREHASLALAALRSRGPDAQTLTAVGETLFAHTRLAVIDLAGGHQPMQSGDGRFTLVFNGEIYNAGELRLELERAGAEFVTDHSDTEVLLQGFIAWGADVLPRLDGMFAFAVWDAAERRLFAARDKLGIKPLMYAAVDGGFIFASSLSPFLALPGFPKRLDPEALRDYLAFQTPLAPQTFLASVRQLPPACCLSYRVGSSAPEVKRWWSIPRAVVSERALEGLLDRVEAALKESVRRQLVTDVPLGAFLSGGIDSSLLVRYMAEATGRPVETFSLKFAAGDFDESSHAAAVARTFGCRHHVLEAPSIDGSAFVAAIRSLDQPLADPAYVMTHALSRLTRDLVTVAVSGDGGDELFGGYARFRDTEDLYPTRAWQKGIRRMIEVGVLPTALMRHTLSGQELLHYRRVELGPWEGRKDMGRYLSPSAARSARVDRTLIRWRDLIRELGGSMDSGTLMRADLWTYLSENCLTKTDRASMAHGLEVRVPFLGQPVLDAVLTLPATVHLNGGSKCLLMALAKKHLPETVWNRPKHGFSVPLQQLFRGAWGRVGQEAISRVRDVAPFLDSAAVDSLWHRAVAGRGGERLAYTVLVLLLWLEGKGIEI